MVPSVGFGCRQDSTLRLRLQIIDYLSCRLYREAADELMKDHKAILPGKKKKKEKEPR